MTAVISACGRYRYALERQISFLGSGRVLWVMLNPSTADAINDDPTITRVKGFSMRLGFATATVVNLFAFRATDPRKLEVAVDPVGPENDAHILRLAETSDLIILAYGARPFARSRASHVRSMLAGHELHCLGKAKSGAPKHPLYLRADTMLELA